MVASVAPIARDRFPWAVLILVFLLQAVLGLIFTSNQRSADIAHSEEVLAANVKVLESILHTNLQRFQYEEIVPLLTQWIDLYQGRVDHLGLIAGNGFVFFEYDRTEPSDDYLTNFTSITYSYHGSAQLIVRWNLDHVNLHARKTLILLGLIQFITTMALVFFLRLATSLKQHTRILAERARDLDQANQDLHHEMEKRAVIEENLAKEKEQLQVTLRSLGDGVVSIDRGGVIRLVNEAAGKMLGCHDTMCIGRAIDDVLDLVEEDSRDEFKLFESGHLVENGEGTITVVLRSRDHKEFVVALASSPIPDRQEGTTGWVLVIRDISETRHLEMEQHKNSMLQALGVLAGGIAHDFNNILMAITGNLNIAQAMTRDNTELEEILSSAERASDRAADLTRQLLTFAKGGSPILDATDIDEVVRESAEFVTHGSDLHIQYDFEENLYPVLIDRHQIGQVIQNLVINARQAMSTGGLLAITCSNVMQDPEEGTLPLVRVEIRDQGAGIPSAVLEHIFDPYFTTKNEGSGLGLAVVHSIITRHKGRIEVQSQPGEGATFTIHLPACDEVLPDMEPLDQPLIQQTGHVLVMDDDRAVRLITGRMVRQLGFDVTEADHGARAIEIYEEHLQRGENIDLVIMDLTVPEGMGGLETVRKLLEIDPRCRAIVSSGYSNDPVMGNHRDYGFKAALVKPFDLRHLSQVLNRVLNHS